MRGLKQSFVERQRPSAILLFVELLPSRAFVVWGLAEVKRGWMDEKIRRQRQTSERQTRVTPFLF